MIKGNGEEEIQPTVKEGETIEVKIVGIGKEGDGIGKFEGFVIIVPKTKVDDVVEVEISKVMRKVAFATVIKKQEN